MGVLKLQQNRKAKLEIEGNSFEFPIIVGSERETAIDISNLRATTNGVITLDNAFVNTAACESAITFLDGELGILRYRGYPIEQLAEKSHFLEVSYLLLKGELPTQAELEQFKADINKYKETPAFIKNHIKSYPHDAHPMAMLSSSIVALSAHKDYAPFLKQDLNENERYHAFCLLLSQIRNIAAYCHLHTQKKSLDISPTTGDYTHDFLNMMFSHEKVKIDADILQTLHVLLILHADHEQNCSTSTVRLVGSSKANPFATISAGINALWGPLHGGANQAVIEMLESIARDGGDYKKAIARAKDKNDSFKLMGFGHRVYKNFDPRSKIIKKQCDLVLKKMGRKDPLLEIAKGLEEEALRDPYFVERKLYPNVDFYSGIIYRALNIPTNMFTVMFALGRTPGWLAQWNEMLTSKDTKIGRPRQIYTGETERKYTNSGK